jgi:hypothetical protein
MADGIREPQESRKMAGKLDRRASLYDSRAAAARQRIAEPRNDGARQTRLETWAKSKHEARNPKQTENFKVEGSKRIQASALHFRWKHSFLLISDLFRASDFGFPSLNPRFSHVVLIPSSASASASRICSW